MKHSIMITSLYNSYHEGDIAYYVSGDSVRPLYCDALLPSEAVSKCILANHPIEEMIVLGNRATYDPSDELGTMVLKDGRSFYTSDIGTLSDYSLLRYRLAQFLDEMHIEDRDIDELLDDEDKQAVAALLKRFLADQAHDHTTRMNRLFGCIAHDEDLRKALWTAMEAELPHYAGQPWQHRRWAMHYLYAEMRDSHKLELLECNENVKIRFIPTDNKGQLPHADALSDILNQMSEKDGEPADVDIYININSENTHDTLTLINLMGIARLNPDSNIDVVQVMATTNEPHALISNITDECTLCNVSELLTGMRTFLAYGKTDFLMTYWTLQGIENDYIDAVLYAMRVIDVGLSLCDINDIERGIVRLRQLFAEKGRLGSSLVERYFAIAIDGIQKDYGPMLEKGGPTFIDLVRWTYRKGLWQQALTIVEARAPKDFVDKGIYYYSNSDESRQKALRILGKEHYDLKPFEKYKMNDVSHYFIKFYGRTDMPRVENKSQIQKAFAQFRIDHLDATEDNILQAFTRCSDREALQNLLYAYYHIGEVRNATNHAETGNDISVIREEWDVSERMDRISQALRFFIMNYEKVMDSLVPSDEPILQVSSAEVSAQSRSMVRQFSNRRQDDHHEDQDRHDDSDGQASDGQASDGRGSEGQGSSKQDSGNQHENASRNESRSRENQNDRGGERQGERGGEREGERRNNNGNNRR